MDLITLVVTLGVVGVLLWLMDTYIPMAAPIKKVINVVVLVVVILWLLQVFGIVGKIGNVNLSKVEPAPICLHIA